MILSILGLSFDIIGVILLYYFGPPVQDIFEDGSEIVVGNPDPIKAEKARFKNKISKIAVVILLVGFVLQLFGNIINSRYQNQIEQQLEGIASTKAQQLNPVDCEGRATLVDRNLSLPW